MELWKLTWCFFRFPFVFGENLIGVEIFHSDLFFWNFPQKLLNIPLNSTIPKSFKFNFPICRQ
jgi:hypothetical protein